MWREAPACSRQESDEANLLVYLKKIRLLPGLARQPGGTA